MKQSVRSILGLMFVLCAAVASALPGAALAETKSAEKFALIHVADLKTLLADSHHKVAVFDANGESTRKKDGIIPGAILLSSFKDYDAAKVLPADKSTTLVFYCANTRCTASHTAAERAVEAGYTNVKVFADGIQGWAAAGEKVETMKG